MRHIRNMIKLTRYHVIAPPENPTPGFAQRIVISFAAIYWLFSVNDNAGNTNFDAESTDELIVDNRMLQN